MPSISDFTPSGALWEHLKVCLPRVPAYHWSPSKNRGSITQGGLIPHVFRTHCTTRQDYVYLAPTPEAAWELIDDTKSVRWDLWVVDLKGKEYETVKNHDGTDREYLVRADFQKPVQAVWQSLRMSASA